MKLAIIVVLRSFVI